MLVMENMQFHVTRHKTESGELCQLITTSRGQYPMYQHFWMPYITQLGKELPGWEKTYNLNVHI